MAKDLTNQRKPAQPKMGLKKFYEQFTATKNHVENLFDKHPELKQKAIEIASNKKGKFLRLAHIHFDSDQAREAHAIVACDAKGKIDLCQGVFVNSVYNHYIPKETEKVTMNDFFTIKTKPRYAEESVVRAHKALETVVNSKDAPALGRVLEKLDITHN